jgi:FAS-associated factor 2
LRILLWPCRFLSNKLFSGSDLDGLSSAVTAKAAQQFATYLRGFGLSDTNNNDAWALEGFADVKQQALQNQSLIFLYLHSPLHRQSQDFCRNVLCDGSMVEWLNQRHVMPLGVSIHTAQGAQLASLLHAAAFPFCALLHPKSSTSMALLLKAQGSKLTDMRVHGLMPHLQTALGRHQNVVIEEETRRLLREQEVDLRRQQDDEYQDSLRADQEREQQAAEERERERQLQEEEEERQHQEQEEQEAVLAIATSLVKPEPESGGTMVRFVLASGVKLDRRFTSDETMEALRAFLRLYFHEKGIEMGRIGLSTSFPRKTYTEQDDQTQTLEDLGLNPQAVLMVQDLDA